MLFQKRFHAGLADGSVTLSYRRWQSPRVKAGGRYRVHPIGEIEVDAVDRVRVGEIRQVDARRAGFADREALLSYLTDKGEGRLTARSQVFRVRLHFAGRPAPAAAPGAVGRAGLEALAGKLSAMDRRSKAGAWTAPTLRLIARHPGRRAADLAAELGRDTLPFKADVRKLKRLGLTRALEVGYEVTPLGRALAKRRGAADL